MPAPRKKVRRTSRVDRALLNVDRQLDLEKAALEYAERVRQNENPADYQYRSAVRGLVGAAVKYGASARR